MALITAFYVAFFRSPCDAQWAGNAKRDGRRGLARYGYPCMAPSGRSKFWVCDRSLLGLSITTFLSLPDEFRTEQRMRSTVQLIAS
jgi:hypothetical protein